MCIQPGHVAYQPFFVSLNNTRTHIISHTQVCQSYRDLLSRVKRHTLTRTQSHQHSDVINMNVRGVVASEYSTVRVPLFTVHVVRVPVSVLLSNFAKKSLAMLGLNDNFQLLLLESKDSLESSVSSIYYL